MTDGSSTGGDERTSSADGGRESAGGNKRIKSVETALDVLEAVAAAGELGVTELGDRIDRPKSTVHHYVSTLESRGYLERTDDRYELGLGLLTLGGRARERRRLYHLARDDVDELAAETGERARLVVEQDGRGVTLYQSDGEAVGETDTHLGSVEDLYCSAAGKAFLAELTDEAVEEYLAETTLEPHTERTITDPAALREELDDIRSRGVAFDDEEYLEGVRCVATAITSREGDLLGAVSISGSVERLDDDRFRTEIPNLLRNVAGVVEINTTYSGWSDEFSP